ncbi:hypothetical protein [Pendulispora albinea]|uniref:Uncharacterized protein n=1 Tax=Pendulispora albinea TaxID=2741071 RepID=A0ABZ2MBJ1_9BACT
MVPLTIDEHFLPDGSRVGTHVSAADEGRALRLVVDGALDHELPIAVLEQVMARYGKPLAEGVVPGGPRIELGDGRALCMLRHRGRYDVIARDYLVFERPGGPPLAELSTSIAGALLHLARAAGIRSDAVGGDE